jgi:hypothetical protein
MSAVERAVLNVPVTIRSNGGVAERGGLDLGWSIVDPLTVHLVFRPDGEASVEWLAGRELLADGVGSVEPVGIGDLTVCAAGEADTCVHLSSPFGVADVFVPTVVLVMFLDGCEDACPFDSDAEAERLDAWVDTFLLTTQATR